MEAVYEREFGQLLCADFGAPSPKFLLMKLRSAVKPKSLDDGDYRLDPV